MLVSHTGQKIVLRYPSKSWDELKDDLIQLCAPNKVKNRNQNYQEIIYISEFNPPRLQKGALKIHWIPICRSAVLPKIHSVQSPFLPKICSDKSLVLPKNHFIELTIRRINLTLPNLTLRANLT